MKITAVNVNGLRDRTSYAKLKTTCNVLKNDGLDIAILIDTRGDKSTARRLRKAWDGPVLTTTPQPTASAGIAIMSRLPESAITNVEGDAGGRYMIADLSIKKESYLLIAVYAPPDRASHRKTFLEDLHKQITKRTQKENIIMLGDFNMVESELDRTRPGILESSSNNYLGWLC